MKRSIWFILSAIPALLCMLAIFHLSSQTASASSDTSANVIEWALSAVLPDFDDAPPSEQKELIASCQFTFRKAAHFSLYTLLGMLWYAPMYTRTTDTRKAALFAWIFAAAYAVTDEIHQKFVPGRSAELRDVLIDSAGAAVGVVLVYVIAAKILARRKNK